MTDRARTAGVFGGRFTSRSRATVKGCVRNGPDAGAGPSFLRDAWGPGPSPRDLLAIFAAAVVLRALLALLSFASFDLCHPACPMRDAGKSLLHLAHDYALRADGKSYMAYARAIHGDAVWIEARDGPGVGAAGLSPEAMARDTGKFEAYDRRVFPGFPMLLAAVALTGIPLPLAALAIPWLCAGLAASLTAKLAGDRRLGWGMALLTPH